MAQALAKKNRLRIGWDVEKSPDVKYLLRFIATLDYESSK